MGILIETPCDIDETLYLLHKTSQYYGDRYEIIKVFCAGVYNYGKGWYAELRTNRNKYKYVEYRVPFTDFGIKVFKTKEEAEERIKLIYS